MKQMAMVIDMDQDNLYCNIFVCCDRYFDRLFDRATFLTTQRLLCDFLKFHRNYLTYFMFNSMGHFAPCRFFSCKVKPADDSLQVKTTKTSCWLDSREASKSFRSESSNDWKMGTRVGKNTPKCCHCCTANFVRIYKKKMTFVLTNLGGKLLAMLSLCTVNIVEVV